MLFRSIKDIAPDSAELDWKEVHALRFADAMNDDFNTPLAVSVLFELANELNKTKSALLARQLKALAGIIGLLQRSPQQFLQAELPGASNVAELEAMVAVQIDARAEAKRTRNFTEADRIRADLLAKGIVLEDKPGGLTEWRRA